jgi:hypothetical protein
MSESTRSDREATGSNPVVAVLIVAVVLIVVGWFGFAVVRSGQASAAFTANGPTFARNWVENVHAGRLDEAYRATTPGFQARLDRAAFGKWVADHPELSLEPDVRGFTLNGASGFMIGLTGPRIVNTSRLTFQTAFHPADSTRPTGRRTGSRPRSSPGPPAPSSIRWRSGPRSRPSPEPARSGRSAASRARR